MTALDWKQVFKLVNDWRQGYLPTEVDGHKGDTSKTRLQRCKNQFNDKADTKHGSADKIENKGTSK